MRNTIATCPGGTDSMYTYDCYADTWSRSVNFGGGARIASTAISVGNSCYMGTGIDYITNLPLNDIWQFTLDTTTSTSAVKDLHTQQVQIFPNPTRGSLNVFYSSLINKIEIYGVDGKLVFTNEYDSKAVQISLKNFSSGLFFLVVNGNVKQKLIVE